MKIKPLLSLARISNLPTVWSNVVCCFIVVYGSEAFSADIISSLVILLFSLSSFYCGGMALNDICDEDYDRQYQSFRPIPSGLISRRQAVFFAMSLFFFAFATLAFAPNFLGLVAGVCLLGTIVLYNLYHKRHTQSVLLMAAARSLVYVVVALALVGEITLAVAAIALIQGAYVLVLTAVARFEEHTAQGQYSWPLIPWLIAAIALVDGIFAAFYSHPYWFGLGLLLFFLTRFFHKYVRGD